MFFVKVCQKVRLLFCFLLFCSIVACTTAKVPDYNVAGYAKVLRAQAYELSGKGQHDLAIIKAEEALHYARVAGHINIELIEAYDDLGLYYYLKKDYQKSAYHQSIAVALSYSYQPRSKMSKVFLERLGWAYAKYDVNFDFTKIQNAPLLLVCENMLFIGQNADVRRFLYSKGKALSPRRKNKLGPPKLNRSVCSV